MSLCINNNLIWISIPRCASTSIENAFYNTDLEINHYAFGKSRDLKNHSHVSLDYLFEKFGLKETVCVKKDYLERWLSSLRFFWDHMEINKIEPIIDWKEIDNEFIYNHFNKDYIEEIHRIIPNFEEMNEKSSFISERILDLDSHFMKNKKSRFPYKFGLYHVFYSQLYWLKGNKCTYEFDVSDIKKFEKFIEDRYSVNFKVPKLNQSNRIPNRIVKNEELKNWVSENFEKKFMKKTTII